MTELTGFIRSRVSGRGRAVDRRSEILAAAWLITDAKFTAPAASAVWGESASAAVHIADAGPVLAVLSDDVPAVAATAAAAIRAERRVYALAPAGWASSSTPDWLAQAPSTLVLVRRVLGAPAAMLVSGCAAWIWTGANGPGPWRLVLDAAQANAARLAFLSLFWNEAEDEGWPAKATVQWRPRGEAPFDIVGPAANAACVLVRGRAELPPLADGSSACTPSGRVPSGAPRRLWVPTSGSGHDALTRVVGAGAEVVWADAKLPACATGPEPVLLASSDRWTLRVALNAEQTRAVTATLDAPTPASFRVATPLGDADEALRDSGAIWLAGAAAAERLLREQVIDAGIVKAALLSDVAHAEPQSLPAAKPLALAVRWSWQVDVPRTPSGDAEDPLVRSWRAVDEGVVARLNSVANRLIAVENRESSIGRMFEALKGALLGFGRSRSDLRAELSALEAQIPSRTGPAAARDILARAADLEVRVVKLESDIEGAEQEERDVQERRRQQAEHQAECEKALAECRAKERELETKRQDLARVEEQIQGLAAADANVVDPDRAAKAHKYGDDKRLLAHLVRELQRTIEKARAGSVRPFEFKPAPRVKPSKGRATFVPPSAEPGGPAVPADALPVAGRLRVAAKQRLLAIRTWEELTVGQAEAARLGARLVADVEEP